MSRLKLMRSEPFYSARYATRTRTMQKRYFVPLFPFHLKETQLEMDVVEWRMAEVP
jgi:hypothetical protein